MAYVKMTERLIDSVRTHIQHMKGVAEEKLRAEFQDINRGYMESIEITIPEHVKLVEQKLWGKHIHLIDQMPNEWINTTSTARIRVYKDENTLAFTIDMKFKGLTFRVPPGTSHYTPTVNMSVKDFDAINPTFIARKVEFVARFKELTEKFEAIRKQVTDYLCTHTSLGAAIKAKPLIKAYIPKTYIERLERKIDRSTVSAFEPSDEEVELDDALLATTYVQHRMAA